MPFANGKAIHGFEHGVVPANVVSDLWEVVSTAGTLPTVIVGAARTGGKGLRVPMDGVNAIFIQMAYARNASGFSPTATNRIVGSFYFRIPTLATTGAPNVWQVSSNAGSVAACRYDPATGKFRIHVGTGANVSVTDPATVLANTWYRADFIYRLDLNPRTFSVRITKDGQATIGAEFTATGPAETASTSRYLNLGSSSSGDTGGVPADFDDVLLSGHAAGDGDYPITPDGFHHRVNAYGPVNDGTHAVGTATFRYTDNNGTAFTTITNGTTVAYQRVDLWPPLADGNASDTWVDKSAGTTLADLVEFQMNTDGAETTAPIGVHPKAAIVSTTATADSCELFLRIGTTDDATKINNGTVGSATKVYRGWCYPLAPGGVAWTLANFNSPLRIRFSSTDISPVPRVKALLLEAAFQYAIAAAGTGIPTALFERRTPRRRTLQRV